MFSGNPDHVVVIVMRCPIPNVNVGVTRLSVFVSTAPVHPVQLVVPTIQAPISVGMIISAASWNVVGAAQLIVHRTLKGKGLACRGLPYR